jgi:hypothetical protein
LATDERLVEDHVAFFDLSVRHDLLLVAALHLRKPAEGQPQAVMNARRLMREAADGRIARRAPIRVWQRADGEYEVIDGNATAAVAREDGWRHIPGTVEREDAVQRRSTR